MTYAWEPDGAAHLDDNSKVSNPQGKGKDRVAVTKLCKTKGPRLVFVRAVSQKSKVVLIELLSA